MRGADRRRWESTVAEGQGSGREVVAEGSPRQTSDHRNTKRQRGRVRATSVLGNAKSKAHQDASSRAAWRGGKAHTTSRCTNPQRLDGAAIVNAKERSNLVTMRELAIKKCNARREMESITICSDELSLICFQPPDTENRTSGGVGALAGKVPPGRPDPFENVITNHFHKKCGT